MAYNEFQDNKSDSVMYSVNGESYHPDMHRATSKDRTKLYVSLLIIVGVLAIAAAILAAVALSKKNTEKIVYRDTCSNPPVPKNNCTGSGTGSNGQVTVLVEHDGKNQMSEAVPNQVQGTALLALNNLHSKNKINFTTTFFYPMGHMITGINGVEANATLKQYWAIGLNGVSANCGIDTLLLENGDQLSFKLKTY